MVAELRLTYPLPELAVGSVLELELGVSRSESYIFESSPPINIGGGAGLFPYENSLSYFARYQFSLSSLQRILMLPKSGSWQVFWQCPAIAERLLAIFTKVPEYVL